MKYLCSALILIALAAVPLAETVSAEETKPVRVTFLAPDNTPFWLDYIAFMEVAAESLGIDLTVVSARNRFEVFKNAVQVMDSEPLPDFLVYMYQAQKSPEVLKLAAGKGIPSIITNTDVIPAEAAEVGKPGTRYRHWLAHLYPNDLKAGQRLVERLIEVAAERGLAAGDGMVHVLGLGGNNETTASTYREKGLRWGVHHTGKAVLAQYVFTNWNRDLARDKTRVLLKRYPEAKVCWTPSDNIAIGAINAILESGRTPGKDVLVGGMDWSPEGIQAIRRGTLEASMGGHFMEGGWALVLIYDYIHGTWPPTEGRTIQSSMRLMDRTNIDTYLNGLDKRQWRRLDFKRFTRTHNPAITAYDFSPDAVVRALAEL